MALVRLTMLFHHASSTTSLVAGPPVRVAGWSESVYYDSNVKTSDQIARLCLRRAALLPNNASIIGQRYQFADGAARTDGVRYSGSSGLSVDVPQMALLCFARNLGEESTRKFTLRGIPDSWVVNGELVPDVGVAQTIAAFFTALVGFTWKARDRNAAMFPITSISDVGVYVMGADVPYAAGDKIRAVRVVDIYGNPVSGNYTVLSTTSLRNGTIANWLRPPVAARGNFQTIDYKQVAFLVGETTVSRVMVQKVGRSFFQYRGRRAKRRSSLLRA